ncbi:MAG: hypothetical protein C0446_13410 [Chitinophaga sp.]|nr:hypothetical protein [Chitinophaga sp.]
MKNYFFVTTILICLFACNKADLKFENKSFNSSPFFTNKSELKEKLSIELKKRKTNEKLIDIESISYINSDSSNYAIIFYNTNSGRHNILFEKSIKPGENEQFKVTSCDGFNCTCKVNVIIDNEGRVIVNCTCSSCIMITQ